MNVLLLQIRSMVEIARAHIGRAWLALGYESWADYIKGEFSHAPLSLPREERRAVVKLLRGQGMSTRAISSATGADRNTVRSDLRSQVDEIHPPDLDPLDVDEVPEPVTGLDGAAYFRPQPFEPRTPWPHAGLSGRSGRGPRSHRK